MQRHYWIKRGEFSNQYALEYTISPDQDYLAERQGYERIPMKEAIRLCRLERDREQNDRMFSGYADDRIWPFGIDRSVVHGSWYYCNSGGYVIDWPVDRHIREVTPSWMT